MNSVLSRKILLFCMMVFLVVFADGCHSGQSETEPAPLQSQQLAPDFTLSDMSGEKVQLSALHGKVVVLNFWATWCPPCREEMPSMQKLAELMADEKFVLLAVNIEEQGRQTVPLFLEEHPVSFPILFDDTGEIHKNYGVFKYPETFIIDPQGRIVEKVVGGIDWSQPHVIKFMRQLLPVDAH